MEAVNNNEVAGGEEVASGVPDEKTITLRKPVTVGKNGPQYTALDLREPTAGELEKASKASTDIGVVLNLISLVAKVPRAVAEGLCQRDLKEASDFLGSFNEDDPITGGTSSPN